MAIVSILHRMSGLLLFLLMPLMLYFLQLSLNSPQSFADLRHTLANPWLKIVLWAFSAALVYHLLAGIRHLLMDLGWGEQLSQGRTSASLVIGCSVILTIFLGI